MFIQIICGHRNIPSENKSKLLFVGIFKNGQQWDVGDFVTQNDSSMGLRFHLSFQNEFLTQYVWRIRKTLGHLATTHICQNMEIQWKEKPKIFHFKFGKTKSNQHNELILWIAKVKQHLCMEKSKKYIEIILLELSCT